MAVTAAVLALLATSSAMAQSAADPESSSSPLRHVAAVTFPHAMVVAAEPAAAEAGLKVLRAGGNAVDAAVAAAYALNVVEPQSSGIGGGLFMLIYLAAAKQVIAIDGREEAPSAATPGWFLRADGTPQPFFPDRITGGRPVGVPGALRAMEKARRHYGRLPLPTDIAPAIELAERGIVVPERLAGQLALHRQRMMQFPASRAVFFPDGEHPVQAGDTLRQPDLARTFRLLAEQGEAAFYDGAIAADIVKAVNEAPVNPGQMTLADLAHYRAPERTPVQGTFHGYMVYGMGPPSSGGVTVQQILSILEDWPKLPPHAPPAMAVQRFTQATRLAFADRDTYEADADFVPVPVKGLLDPDYLRQRAQSLDWRAPLAPVAPGHPAGAPVAYLGTGPDTEHWSTSHLVVVDADRNMVSMTTTIEQGFGSGMVVPGRGFLLNNELTDFSPLPVDAAGVPIANRVDGARHARSTAVDIPSSIGGKRPRSSMAPTLVFRDGRPVLALGSPGGSRIIPFVAAALVHMLEQDMPLQQAVEQPHATNVGGATTIEPELDTPALRQALQQLGHKLMVARQASGLNGVWIDPGSGTLHAGIDPRREGSAAGY